MGILNALKLRQNQETVAAGVQAAISSVRDPSTMPYATPWQTSELQRWVYEDLFGDLPDTTRDAAMRIAAIARARNLVCTSIGKQPLVPIDPSKIVYTKNAETGEVEEDYGAAILPTPYWMTHTADGSSPQHRMVWTVDDLIFYGLSCWWRDKPGTDQETRSRLNQEDWEIDSDSRRILVNGTPAADNQVILFTGFHEGILRYGREVVSDTRRLFAIVRDRLQNPIPMIDLHQTGGVELNTTEQDDLKAKWAAARQGDKSGVGFTNQWIEAKPLGADMDANLMIASRNAAAVECARLVGIHANQIDASGVNSTLTYETPTSRNEEFTDFDLDLYLEPIQARLSLDDVAPPGERVAFNGSQFHTLKPSPLGQPAVD